VFDGLISGIQIIQSNGTKTEPLANSNNQLIHYNEIALNISANNMIHLHVVIFLRLPVGFIGIWLNQPQHIKHHGLIPLSLSLSLSLSLTLSLSHTHTHQRDVYWVGYGCMHQGGQAERKKFRRQRSADLVMCSAEQTAKASSSLGF
jgi:hypothetical protein